jgi:hypothetical protein
MRRVPLVAVCFVASMSLIAASPRQSAPNPTVPPAVATLLAQARAHLKAGRDVSSIVSLDVAGTETRLLEPRPKVDPYEFKLLLPDSFQLRTGPILHTLARGVYGRRLLDAERYGGTLVDRMLADAESQKTAAQSIQFHFMRICLTYLARVPPAMIVTVEDRGVRDFTRVKGRTISFHNPGQGIRIELVLDAATAQPLATVCHGRTSQGTGSSADSDWISVFGDYREVAGVRFPHRIEEWIGMNHSRVVVTKIGVNVLKPEDFVGKTPPPR